MEDNYLERKKVEVLKAIKPICDAFGISDYDYIVSEEKGIEMLRIYSQEIMCSYNSVSAVIDELVGYIFIKKWCRNRSLGAFETQTKNVIKRYWVDKK